MKWSLFFIGIFVAVSMCFTPGNAVAEYSLTETRLQPYLAPNQANVVIFSSSNCGYCSNLKPVWQAMRNKYGRIVNFVFLDMSEYNTIAMKVGVEITPTQIFFDKRGYEVYRIEGAGNDGEFADAISQLAAR